MAINGQSNKSPTSALTPDRAVSIGHLVVNLPLVVIIGLAGLLAFLALGRTWVPLGLFLGIIPAWLWWSFMVPRWREWAKREGADENETQIIGERQGLVWPKGSFFERTEFDFRKKSRAERQTKQGSAKTSSRPNYSAAVLFLGGIFFIDYGSSAFLYSRWSEARNALVHPVYHPWAIVVGLLMIGFAYWVRHTTD